MRVTLGKKHTGYKNILDSELAVCMYLYMQGRPTDPKTCVWFVFGFIMVVTCYIVVQLVACVTCDYRILSDTTIALRRGLHLDPMMYYGRYTQQD